MGEEDRRAFLGSANPTEETGFCRQMLVSARAQGSDGKTFGRREKEANAQKTPETRPGGVLLRSKSAICAVGRSCE